MGKQSSINLDVTVTGSDGYSIGGGTVKRTLIVSGSDMTLIGTGPLGASLTISGSSDVVINASGSNVITFPSSSATVAGLNVTQSFTTTQFFNAPVILNSSVTASAGLNTKAGAGAGVGLDVSGLAKFAGAISASAGAEFKTSKVVITGANLFQYLDTNQSQSKVLACDPNGNARWVVSSSAITSLNGASAATYPVQSFTSGSSGVKFNIVTTTSTHSFNLPTSSLASEGALTSGSFDNFNDAWRAVSSSREPMGFVDRTQTSMSYALATRTFTLSTASGYPSYEYFVGGKGYITGSSKTVQWGTQGGLWFIYFNRTDPTVLTASSTAWTFPDNAMVATIYYNTESVSPQVYSVGEERHGSVMDWATHQWIHTNLGTRYSSGLTFADYTANNTTTGSAIQFSCTSGIISDEDIRMTITPSNTPANPFEQKLSFPAKIPIWYRSGSSGKWIKAQPLPGAGIGWYPVLTGSNGRVVYNQDLGATGWTLTETTNTDHVAYWAFAADDVDTPIIFIMGQRDDTTLANAQAGNTLSSLSLGGLPSSEWCALYRVIYQTNNAYQSAGVPRAAIREVLDYRTSQAVGSAFTPTAHSSLANLDYASSGHTGFAGTATANTFTATQSLNAGLSVVGTVNISPNNFAIGNVAGVDRISGGYTPYPSSSIRFLNTSDGYAGVGMGWLGVGQNYALSGLASPSGYGLFEAGVSIAKIGSNAPLDVNGNAIVTGSLVVTSISSLQNTSVTGSFRVNSVSALSATAVTGSLIVSSNAQVNGTTNTIDALYTYKTLSAGQNASISATNITNSGASGMYLVSIGIEVDNYDTGPATTVYGYVKWLNAVGSILQENTSTMSAASFDNYTYKTFVVSHNPDSGQLMQWGTTSTYTTGSADTYKIIVNCIRLY